jgi:hypothetical protein
MEPVEIFFVLFTDAKALLLANPVFTPRAFAVPCTPPFLFTVP